MALSDDRLSELAAEAARWGLDVLWEAHSPEEVRRAVALGPDHRHQPPGPAHVPGGHHPGRPHAPRGPAEPAGGGRIGDQDRGRRSRLARRRDQRDPGGREPHARARSRSGPAQRCSSRHEVRHQDLRRDAARGRGVCGPTGRHRHRTELLARVEALRRGHPGARHPGGHAAPRAEGGRVRERPPAGGDRDPGRAAAGHGAAARGRAGGQLGGDPAQAHRARHPGLRRGVAEGCAGLGSGVLHLRRPHAIVRRGRGDGPLGPDRHRRAPAVPAGGRSQARRTSPRRSARSVPTAWTWPAASRPPPASRITAVWPPSSWPPSRPPPNWAWIRELVSSEQGGAGGAAAFAQDRHPVVDEADDGRGGATLLAAVEDQVEVGAVFGTDGGRGGQRIAAP